MFAERKNSNPLAVIAAVAGACVAATEIGHLVSLPQNLLTFWPSAGLMLAFVLHQPFHRWPLVLLGALLANLISDVVIHDRSVMVAMGCWLANSTETLVAACLCRVISRDMFALLTVRRVIQFVFLPCLIGTAAGASLGAAVLSLAYQHQYLGTWKTWWSGNFTGMLVMFPFVHHVLSGKRDADHPESDRVNLSVPRQDFILFLGVLIIHGLLTTYIFGFQSERLAYAIYPTLLWIVIRFKITEANVGLLLTAVIMVAYSANGHGLFGGIEDLRTRAIVIQVFLCVTSATFLILAASMQERRESASHLLTAKQQLEAYVDLIGKTDGSWSWNLLTDNIQFSPRYREMLGYNANDTENFPDQICSFTNAVHPEDRERLLEKMDDHLQNDSIFQDEYRMQLSDGSYRWFRVRANTTRSDDHQPLIMAGSSYDVTDRKEIELQLNRSNTDLAQFAYVASHDLQEPLRAVSGFCQLLERKYSDSLDAKAKGYIQSAVDGVSRMSTLIKDLLAFSKVGNEQRPFAPVDLNDVIVAVRGSLSTMIAESNALISVDQDLPTVDGDSQMLAQLFQNLLSNAIKFRSPDEPLMIDVINRSTSNVHEIVIQDNGVGIAPSYQDQIFTMFQRLHRQEDVSGTGIGLAICKRVVDRHGGEIRVESSGAGGSQFVVQFPTQEMQDA